LGILWVAEICVSGIVGYGYRLISLAHLEGEGGSLVARVSGVPGVNGA